QIEQTIKIIAQGAKGEYEGIQSRLDDEDFDWEADWGDEENVIGKKIKVDIADMGTRKWQEDLNEDLAVLNHIWNSMLDVRGKKDFKLQQLIDLLDNKVTKPFNPGNKKAIIFTAFADTANYLYDNIQGYLKENYGIHTALITGSRKTSNAMSI